MRKFRKKPITIEAFIFLDDPIPDWFMDKVSDNSAILYSNYKNETYMTIIKTLEGSMTARQGDYIIQGIKGEVYPCAPDIFKMTYDEVLI